MPMLISVCGTPGTGKTTAVESLKTSGWNVVQERDLIQDLSLFERIDEDHDEMIVEPDDLRSGLIRWATDLGHDTIIDGHLSYLAPSDMIILLRLDPGELSSRLSLRGYDEEKIRDNVEAEAVGYLVTKCIEEEEAVLGGREWKEMIPGGKLLMERDVTGLSSNEITAWINEVIDAYRGKKLNVISRYRPGNVDWLEAHSKWY
jgi:adenylate kinase